MPTEHGPDLAPIQALLPYSYHFADAAPHRFIRFNPRYYDAVLSGRKSATSRFNDPTTLGPAWLVFEFDDRYRTLHATIDAIDSKQFAAIPETDAQLEGSTSAQDLRDGLRLHYLNITDTDSVDVVHFHIDLQQPHS